ncbi:hypothetical protein N7491_010550 [Penicillium cf. griseofulvum]|uniref:Uncharacterized protein n=1 Tax=Penicillium cf. griseofulvum TaxID=2972120 RepID=A0A9W9T671_9EURO|nr:hypothetical protein N7472_000880 [Penicillium cf. griseofulvum]KAJ5422105.1 hypothetical protein N7491_010550 [Penicillium cf. griseofulvum]KAJ5428293.1 hypothetical protein N7445_009747 [Penicillium cf. griseofulvum]
MLKHTTNPSATHPSQNSKLEAQIYAKGLAVPVCNIVVTEICRLEVLQSRGFYFQPDTSYVVDINVNPTTKDTNSLDLNTISPSPIIRADPRPCHGNRDSKSHFPAAFTMLLVLNKLFRLHSHELSN